ncbi:hypothetical protein SanaruYs_00980 [Chryseotalea sanaruensis]|uniref:Uncharacterized protein n=1 Tax=Chryseotalea sanaruensis TaxID=2482724 RepID=A0A401U4I9_9BACT|nr:hypothetical protein SanaruYs_00980 [Chryseotalea sanaruensis]
MQFAKQKKIKRIGFISSPIMNYQGMNNFNWWVFDVKRKAVDMVKQSGIPYTIFYPSTFMDNFNLLTTEQTLLRHSIIIRKNLKRTKPG